MTATPDISVVICTYSFRRWQDLLAAIDSVRSQSLRPLEIIVVVDHDPAILELLRSAAPDVVGIENGGSRGLSAARNSGVAASRGAVVAFLDDDAVADPDWLKRLAAGYRDPHVGAVGGSVDPDWQLGRPRWFPREFDWVVGCTYPGLPSGAAPTRNLVGANMSFRRDVLESVGGFRTGIGRLGTTPLGCEETELCIRASSTNGMIVLYDPTAQVRHRVPPSRGSWSYFFKRCYAEGLSKARVSALVGSGDGLRSERRYSLEILPRRIARGIGETLHGDASGLPRAFAICAGLAVTATGFAIGSARPSKLATNGDGVGVLPRARARGFTVPRTAASTVLLVLALLLWLGSLRAVDLSGLTDVGLVSVLPASALIAFALLAVSFTLALSSPARTPLLFVHVLALIVVLFGTAPLIETVPRFGATWKHIGITDYIATHGRVNPDIDAYFNWPGFFIFNAFVTKAAGLHNAIVLARWAPLFFNLLYLPALVMIASTATRDMRLVALALWLFYVGNWVGQDYLSPQAITYFLYLVVVAILMRWFAKGEGVALRPVQRAGLAALAILLFAAIVPSHQLTPFAAVIVVGALASAKRCTLRTLPILMIVLTAAWITFVAAPYLAGHAAAVAGDAGKIQSTVGSGVVNRVGGSPEHVFVVLVRMLLTMSLWGLAAFGRLRAMRRRAGGGAFALLAVAPFLLLVLQAYGGEILLRIELFALPFAAFLAARLFFVDRSVRLGGGATVALAGVTVTLLFGSLVARYGNERMDYYTPDELAAVQKVYATAPPGSLLMSVTGNLPWKFHGYASYDYTDVTGTPAWRRLGAGSSMQAVVRSVARDMRSRPARHAYLVLTRSEAAELELFGAPVPHAMQKLERALEASPVFVPVYRSPNARVFAAAPRRSR